MSKPCVKLIYWYCWFTSYMKFEIFSYFMTSTCIFSFFKNICSSYCEPIYQTLYFEYILFEILFGESRFPTAKIKIQRWDTSRIILERIPKCTIKENFYEIEIFKKNYHEHNIGIFCEIILIVISILCDKQ